jgi:signal transduction histidine kinase
MPSSGERRFRQVNATPVADSTGTIIGVVSVVHDITERRRTEAALLRANKDLNLLTKLTRHDIMNQINKIDSMSLRLRKTEISDQQDQILRHIEGSIATVKRQLEFTKTYQEIGIQRPSWQDLTAVISKAASSPSLSRLGIRIEGADHEVFADPLLEKVFFEILDNSVRHGMANQAVLTFAERETALEVSVSDDGIGIPDEVRPQLFEYGHGGDSGLGLYLSRDILASTEIGIEERGRAGEGAMFVIIVPQGYWRHKAKPGEDKLS